MVLFGSQKVERVNFSDGRYAQNYKKYESKKSHIVTQAHASLALLQKNFQIKIHGYCVGIGRDFLLVDEQTEAVTLVERAFGSDGIDGDETAGSDGSAAQQHFADGTDEHRANVFALMPLGNGQTANLDGRIAIEMLLVGELLAKLAPNVLGNGGVRHLVVQQAEIGNGLVVILQNKSVGDELVVEITGIVNKKAVQRSVATVERLHGLHVFYSQESSHRLGHGECGYAAQVFVVGGLSLTLGCRNADGILYLHLEAHGIVAEKYRRFLEGVRFCCCHIRFDL